MKTFRAYADDWRGKRHFHVHVRVFDSRQAMQENIEQEHFGPAQDCHGQCSGVSHYNASGKLTGRFAVMWLNAQDLKARPAELVSHECIHAAMRHMKNHDVDLSEMAGEEALCYTAGSLTSQINDRLHNMGVFS